jgi:spheroidene monooxygenase
VYANNHKPGHALCGVVVVLLVNFLASKKSWGWMRLAQGASGLKNQAGLQFAKVMGSGHDGGFSLRPSSTHQGLITLFDTLEHAQTFLAGRLVAQYQDYAREWCASLMVVDSSRGQWNQQAWGSTDFAKVGLSELSQGARVATLTRASIRPVSAQMFWRFAPQAQADLYQSPGCILAMGLGEAPLVRQCTFSIWRNTQAMLDYSLNGAHRAAIQAAYKHGFFSESMFVRMRVVSLTGIWRGIHYYEAPAAAALDLAHA